MTAYYRKKHIITFILFFIFSITFAQKNIKSIQLRVLEKDNYTTVIPLGKTFELSFDDLDADQKEYSYKIDHMTFDWKPSNIFSSEFIEGFQENLISSYENSKTEYLVLSSAASDPFKENFNRSISIGMLLSPHLKKKLHFLKEETFSKKTVGVTCETCSVTDCKERVADPWRLERQQQYNQIAKTVENIINSYK